MSTEANLDEVDQKIFQELFVTPNNEFSEFIKQRKNDRVIFSGKYGSGKTTFLNTFFLPENQTGIFGSEKYDVYKISPVNYSISSNEDIVKYIKYDIVIQFLKKSKGIKEINLRYLDTLPQYVLNNLPKVAATILHMIPKVGKDLATVFEKVNELLENFKAYHKDVIATDGDVMIKYLEELESKDGSIYENDVISKIISSVIEEEPKESILIVDDLDRLDPEHIFRILNVFAAHLGLEATTEWNNKFSFKKIIIVCDIKNLRCLFHHKHGIEVDFNGYIDKFYSSDIYHFDNKEAITSIIKNIVNSVMLVKSPKLHLIETIYYNDFLNSFVYLLIDTDCASLRNIMRLYGKILTYYLEPLSFSQTKYLIKPHNLTIALQLRIVRDLFGDYHNMLFKIKQAQLANKPFTNFDGYIKEMLILSTLDVHHFNKLGFYYLLNGEQLLLQYKGAGEIEIFNIGTITIDKTVINGIPRNLTTSDFWNIVIKTVEKLHEIGYLK